MSQTDLHLFGIGQTLREAREAKGLVLSDVAMLLRIREAHLAALENDDYDSLPGKVYAIGFIRTYSNHLGLDAAELIDRYKGLNPSRVYEEPVYDVTEDDEPMSPALKITAGVALIAVVYLVWLFAGSPNEQIVVSPAPPEVTEELDETAPSAVAEAKNDDALQTPTAAGDASEAAVDEADAASVEALVQTEIASATEPKIADETTATEAAAEPPVTAEAAVLSTDTIQIRAKRRTWMRIESSEGKVLYSSIISKNDSFDLDANKSYFLATRDAGALEYVINDIAGATVGRRGQILTKRRLDRDTIFASQQ